MKGAYNRALVESLHGSDTGIRCLPPIEYSEPHPLPTVFEQEASDLPGWGPGYVLPDGAQAIFGDLGGAG